MTQLSEFMSPEYHISVEELCISANISTDNIMELIEYNIITPITGTQLQEWQFNITALRKVKKAARLHRDLEINWADIGLVLTLLDDIEQLRNENSQLKQQLTRFLVRNA